MEGCAILFIRPPHLILKAKLLLTCGFFCGNSGLDSLAPIGTRSIQKGGPRNKFMKKSCNVYYMMS